MCGAAATQYVLDVCGVAVVCALCGLGLLLQSCYTHKSHAISVTILYAFQPSN